jgi:hypothetical protein
MKLAASQPFPFDVHFEYKLAPSNEIIKVIGRARNLDGVLSKIPSSYSFRGHNISIRTASYFRVADIRVGKFSLLAIDTEIPAEVFNGYDSSIDFPSAQGQLIELSIRNIDKFPHHFLAVIHGYAVNLLN